MSKFHHLGVLGFFGVRSRDEKRQNGSHGCSFENFAILKAFLSLGAKFFIDKVSSEC